MSYVAVSVLDADVFYSSRVLKQSLPSLGLEVLARLDAEGGCLCLGSLGLTEPRRWSAALRRAERVDANPGQVAAVRRIPSETAAWLERASPTPGAWSIFEIRFASGTVDQVALMSNGTQGSDLVECVLRAVWPVLRENCLREFTSNRRTAADALLWTISHRFGTAVLVLDAQGQVLQANKAGMELLAERRLLRELPDGLGAASEADTKALRRAVSECLTASPDVTEIMFLVEDPEGPGRLPLSLTRFDGGDGVSLAVLVVPQRPDPKRIEKLAQMMGLTPAEARVAALMQLGLSNREAADFAGLKEQTFNTYAKRVLSKLNVGCRAEVAQMLTWQAGLGIAS
jgi:DNA-binding CsgD family transcriptional regulator